MPKIWKLSPNFQNHEMAGLGGGVGQCYLLPIPFNIILFWFKFGLHMLRWLEEDSLKNTHKIYITCSWNSWTVWVWFFEMIHQWIWNWKLIWNYQVIWNTWSSLNILSFSLFLHLKMTKSKFSLMQGTSWRMRKYEEGY